MDPPIAISETWRAVDDVADWAELTGTKGDMSTARGSFYRALGCLGSEHYRFLGTLTEADFETLLPQAWRI